MAAAKPGSTSAELLRLFNQAVALHGAGSLDQARPIYEQLLRRLPEHPDLLDLYGTLRHQLGDHVEAAGYVAASIGRRPAAPAAWNHLGSIRRALGLRDQARAAFLRAAVLDPATAEPWTNMSIVANDGGDREGTVAAGRRALSVRPALAEVRVQVGAALHALGRVEEARQALGPVLASDPTRADLALHLSAILAELGEHRAALDSVRRGLVASPTVHELYPRLIGARDPEVDTAAFLPWSRFATCLRPREPRLWSNRSAELYRAAEFADAFRAAMRAAVLEPADRSALQNMVAATYNLRRYEQGELLARRCLTVHPTAADVRFALAEIELVIGDLGTAWTLYEDRVGRADAMPRVGLPRRWRGPGSEDGPLLVAAEQGIGDEVVFLSCLPDLLATVSVPLVVEVDRRLVPVMERSFPGVSVVPRQYPQDPPRRRVLDYRALTARESISQVVFAGSLPRYFRSDRSSPCERRGYLTPDPRLVAGWRAQLARHKPAATVGLVWRSARMTRFRAHFHAEILDWAPILSVPGCVFVSLMPGEVDRELELVRDRLGVTIERPEGLDPWNDIESLMALMAALDVVVAARTATCAFAGAIGVPTIRVAQSFYRITDDRDLFFGNVIPVLDRLAPFDPRAGAEAAGRLLREWTDRP